jgi:hypothetical protein
MQYGNNIICKAQSNLWKLDDANSKKHSLDLLFLSSQTSTCNGLSREIGGKTNWFLDCIQNITSQSQAIKLDALGLGTKLKIEIDF